MSKQSVRTVVSAAVCATVVVGIFLVAAAPADTIFLGGTNPYNSSGSWDNGVPAPGNDGTVSMGIAYHNGDLNMNNYNLTIDGGTVAIGRAITRGLNVVHTAGRWEDGWGQTGLFLGWDTTPSTYELSGTGEVELGRMHVGRFAPGTFDQLGGSVLVDGNLTIAEGAGAAGSAYNLTRGTVTAGGLLIPHGGTFNFLGNDAVLTLSGDVRSQVNSLIGAGKLTGVSSQQVKLVGGDTVVQIDDTTFLGGTNPYNVASSWDNGVPALGNWGTVSTGIAYHDGDLDMANYTLTIAGGTVAVGRAKLNDVNVVHTAGRWEDGTGPNASGGSGLFLGWDSGHSTYELSGTGEIDVWRLLVGRSASTATFNQTGGSVIVDATSGEHLRIEPGGVYNLMGGTVTASELEIRDDGIFNFLGRGLLKLDGDVQSHVNNLIDVGNITGVTSQHVWFDGAYTNVFIPEPGTWLLLLSAVACGLLMRGRRGG